MNHRSVSPVIILHTGACAHPISLESEILEKESIKNSLLEGWKILKAGGSSLDAAEAACVLLENNPLHNAGFGSSLNLKGECELDASIMDGKTLQAGAVAGTRTIKNPVKCARLLLEERKHILLVGNGADMYAKKRNLQLVSNSYFITEKESQLWNRDVHKYEHERSELHHDTVGVVCLDKFGNIASATSSGGLMFKYPGRVGDSPLIGSGTYANNETCGVSCTGYGEFFIRNVSAYHVHALMRYKGYSLAEAANEAMDDVERMGGIGGLIALDSQGNVSMPYNTSIMGRGLIKDDICEIYIDRPEKERTETVYDLGM